jgi:hypothetical protein
MDIPEIFKNEIIYVLLITLSSPIIGIKNYNNYYNNENNYIIPVYEEVMVIKYGKVDSVSNIDNRIKQIKYDYSVIDIKLLLLIKSNDLNIKSIALLERDFTNYINMKTSCRLRIAARKDECIYKLPNEFISVSFESLYEIKKIFH